MKKIKNNNITEALLKQGVGKLKKFGFINVTTKNITKDEVYSLYFLKMLKEMLGENFETDDAIKQLLKLINPMPKQEINNENFPGH